MTQSSAAARVPFAAPAPPRLPDVLPLEADTDDGVLDQITDVLERFHGDEHVGSFRFCYERPRREIAGITRGTLL